jgi:two-component system, OmpR family, phosphate regulon response regulator PhoB
MKKRIVIIEDDKDILDMMDYILTDEGYDIVGYSTIEGVKTVAEQRPALVLLDNRLSNGYGNALCLSLKSDPATGHIPVILVSAAHDLEQIVLECRADGYLKKPFNISDLTELTRRYA